MILYRYEAMTQDGMMLSGEVRAATERAAIRVIESRGLTALKVTSAQRRQRRAGRVRIQDLTVSLFELATMLSAGVGLAEAVAAQADTVAHPTVAKAFGEVSQRIQRGISFSSALAESGLAWPAHVHQLAKAGEATGDLGAALADAAAQMEYDQRVAGDLRNALLYPAILVTTGLAAVIVLFVFVVPKFSPMLSRGAELPWLSAAVLTTGQWLNQNMLAVAVLAGALVAGIVAALRSPATRRRALDVLGSAPLIGEWLREADAARWSRSMGTMLTRRVPLLQAMSLATEGVRLPALRTRMEEVERRVKAGLPLADALEDNQALSAAGYNLVRVGERTGKLPAMLVSLAGIHEEAGRQRMKRLLTVIEPVAILLIGSVVGLIILGVILAITSANELVL